MTPALSRRCSNQLSYRPSCSIGDQFRRVRLPELAGLDLPILVGPSRKSFLGQSTEEGQLFASAAAVTACVLGGAHIVRVHDVKEMATVVRVADALRG